MYLAFCGISADLIILARSWLWELAHKISCSSFRSVFAWRLPN